MKQITFYIFLLLLLMLPCTAFSQRAVVGLSKLKVLYIGMDNPVEIAISGIPEDKIVVNIEGGTITGEKGIYFVKPIDSPGIRQATISVGYRTKKNKIIHSGTFSFRLKEIPPPKVFFGSKEGGLISTAELRLQTVLSAQIENFIYEGLRYKILSYNFNILSETNIFSITDTNARLSDKIIQHLNNTRAGDIIIIDEIKVLSPNGEVRNVSPIKFTVYDQRTPKTVEAKEKYIKAFSYNSASSYSDGCNYYTINREYKNNKKEGNWKYFVIKNSANYLLKQDSFSNDLIVESKYFFSNNKIHKHIFFNKPDYDTGNYKSYFPSGKVESAGKIVQNDALIYYPETEEFRKQHVKGMDILEAMKVREEDYFPSDFDLTIARHGEWKFYYENGNLRRKGSYYILNDEKTGDGFYFRKYKTSIISRDGKWSFYEENGKLEKEIIYEKGKIISEKKY